MNETIETTAPPEQAAPSGSMPNPPPKRVRPPRSKVTPVPVDPETPPLERPAGAVTRSAIPPCPDEDPQAGDKTPAVVAWWFKHHPQQAAVKYHGRKFQPLTAHE